MKKAKNSPVELSKAIWCFRLVKRDGTEPESKQTIGYWECNKGDYETLLSIASLIVSPRISRRPVEIYLENNASIAIWV